MVSVVKSGSAAPPASACRDSASGSGTSAGMSRIFVKKHGIVGMCEI